ncbi:amino acid permease [Neobacillus niacini]|nr:amino acid permease [Neobacillus niacini]
MFVPALLYLVSASALHDMAPGVPLTVWVIIFIAINTVINIRGIEFTARANKIIVILELIILAIFVIVGIVAIAKGVNGAEVLLNHYMIKAILA